MPAQADIQSRLCHCGNPNNLDSRFRGNDGIRKAEVFVTVIANGSTKEGTAQNETRLQVLIDKRLEGDRIEGS